MSLGVIEFKPNIVRERGDRLAEGEQLRVDLLGRAVPVVRTPDGLRAVNKGKPGTNRKDTLRRAMVELAAAYEPGELHRRGCRLTSSSGRPCPGRVWLGRDGRAGSDAGAAPGATPI